MIPINKQEPLKAEESDGSNLLVHSIFYTIQGEGPHAGKPAVFIRLAGCNLQCPGCDTEYSHGAERLTFITILSRVAESHGDGLAWKPLVVITGGEPFRQNIIPLIEALRINDYRVQVETNGTLAPDEWTVWDFDIVVSPKAGKVSEALWSKIIAYKYVLDGGHIDERDGLPTSVLGMPAKPARPHSGFAGEVYVQPADVSGIGNPMDWENQKNLEATIQSAMKYGYRLCIQTHKVAGLD